MGKIAFLFAGQGSQYIGMGKDLYDQIPICKQVFEEASDSLNVDLMHICFDGDKSELDKTINTQPSVATMSLAAYYALDAYDIKPDVVAGLSLGEYTALTVSGFFDIAKVIPLVRKRAIYMQSATPLGVGKMVAVLGTPGSHVEEACTKANVAGVVEISNYNCPGQIVIGGENAAVDLAVEILAKEGVKRMIELPVSAPFHTSLLKGAADKLKAELDQLELGELGIPVISNLTGDYIMDSKEVVDTLYQQVMKSVLWEQSIRKMIDDGVSDFVELGPGRTLSGFVKKIDRNVNVYHVENVASLMSCVSSLGN